MDDAFNMNDPITIQRVALLHPQFIPIITGFIDEVESYTGLVWRVVQGLRTWAEQAAIYLEGRKTPGPNVRPGHPLGDIVTYSPAGFSWHNYGLAVDAAPLVNGSVIWTFDYKVLQPIAKGHNIEMGLFFPHPDSDHFEHKFGLDIKEAYHRETVKDFIPGTQFINLAA